MSSIDGAMSLEQELSDSQADCGKSQHQQQHKKVSRKWSEEEVFALAEAIARAKQGEADPSEPLNWADIAKSVPGRTGKQCREKYKNDLRPDISKEPWVSREEYILARAHSVFGNQWAEIAKFLPGRSENSIKNHWNATLRSKAESRTRTFLWGYGRTVLDLGGVTSREAFQHAVQTYVDNSPIEPLHTFQVPEEYFRRAVSDPTKPPRPLVAGSHKPRAPRAPKAASSRKRSHRDSSSAAAACQHDTGRCSSMSADAEADSDTADTTDAAHATALHGTSALHALPSLRALDDHKAGHSNASSRDSSLDPPSSFHPHPLYMDAGSLHDGACALTLPCIMELPPFPTHSNSGTAAVVDLASNHFNHLGFHPTSSAAAHALATSSMPLVVVPAPTTANPKHHHPNHLSGPLSASQTLPHMGGADAAATITFPGHAALHKLHHAASTDAPTDGTAALHYDHQQTLANPHCMQQADHEGCYGAQPEPKRRRSPPAPPMPPPATTAVAAAAVQSAPMVGARQPVPLYSVTAVAVSEAVTPAKQQQLQAARDVMAAGPLGQEWTDDEIAMLRDIAVGTPGAPPATLSLAHNAFPHNPAKGATTALQTTKGTCTVPSGFFSAATNGTTANGSGKDVVGCCVPSLCGLDSADPERAGMVELLELLQEVTADLPLTGDDAISYKVDEAMLQAMIIKTEPALDHLTGAGAPACDDHHTDATDACEFEAPGTAPRAHRFALPRPFLEGFAPPKDQQQVPYAPEPTHPFMSPSPLVGRRPTMLVHEATELPAFLHLHQPMGAVAAVRHHQQLFSAASQPMMDGFSFNMPQSVRHTPTAGRRTGRILSTAVAAAHMMQSPVQLLYHNPHHFASAMLSSPAHRMTQLQSDDDSAYHPHRAAMAAAGATWVPACNTGGYLSAGGGGGALPTLSFRGCDAPVPRVLATHAL